MHSIIEGFAAAFRLIITLNPELWRIILLSLQVSGTALLLATFLAYLWAPSWLCAGCRYGVW